MSCKQDEMHEVVVIGGGLMGSASAWQLSRNGGKVLLLEQQDTTYTFGSSQGEARISRVLGVRDDIFSYLQQTSVKETQLLVEYLNDRGYQISMDDIYNTSPVTYLYHGLSENESTALLTGQDIKTEYYPDSNKANDIGISLPPNTAMIREYNPYSGTMNPKVLIQSLHLGIGLSGSSVRYNQQVISLEKEGGVFHVKLKDTKNKETKEITARNVIVAAGPYSNQVLSGIAPYFEDLIDVKRLALCFLSIDPEAYQQLDEDQKERLLTHYPIADINEDIYYSMIEKMDENGVPLIKVGGHNIRKEIKDLDKIWQLPVTQEEINWSIDNTLRYFEILNIPLDREALSFHHGYSCVYSLTASEVPFVTNVIDENGNKDENLVLVGGMSGIGAKGALAYGLITSQLISNVQDTSDLHQKTVKALGFERLHKELAGEKIIGLGDVISGKIASN